MLLDKLKASSPILGCSIYKFNPTIPFHFRGCMMLFAMRYARNVLINPRIPNLCHHFEESKNRHNSLEFASASSVILSRNFRSPQMDFWVDAKDMASKLPGLE
jgi:hypothetical protein